MAIDRQWLIDQVLSFIHDSGLATEAESWVDMALADVSRVLRCSEMETLTAYNTASSPFTLWPFPANLIQIQAVQVDSVNGRFQLRPATAATRGTHENDAGVPEYYQVLGRSLATDPIGEHQIYIGWVGGVELPDSDSTHPAVTAFPSLFLDAVKQHAYDWKEDFEASAMYQGRWYQKALEIRNQYENERYGSGLAMRAS